MSKVSTIQNNFNGGEVSPLLYGRPDIDRYKTGLKTVLNFVPLVQGPLERRPGTKHIVAVKDSTKTTRLVRFEFSTTQAYILEFGNLVCRFIKDRAIIENGGSPVELTTTYVEADLFSLRFTQSADVLYITHNDYAPRKLTRTSDIAWTITNITFSDGPFLNTNATATTFALSGTSGSITVTASAVTGINAGDGFQTTDVGRQIRWEDPAGNWTYLTITARASTTSVTATIDGPNASAGTATATWRLGVWSATTGFPAVVTFHQNRLCFGGPTSYPQRLDLSITGDFENMAPTEADGTVVDDGAITDTLSADQVNVIRWVASDEKGLVIGTTGGEWVLRATDAGGLVTPSNVQSTRSSAYGSAAVAPLRAGRALLFVQRAARKLRELAFSFEDDGFRSPDLTLISEQITRTGIVEMAYQAEPQSVIWCVLTNGTLISLTYDREQKVVGWARHTIAGVSDAAGTTAVVESVAVIPNPSGTADEVYLIVRRRVDGATVRYVSYIKPFWDSLNDQEDAFFVDSGLSLDDPKTITAITAADPPVVTSATHGFSDGDEVRITEVVGMVEVNKVPFTVGEVATNTFELFGNIKITAAISAATRANPVVITAAAHGLSNTDEILIINVLGMTELNGNGYTVANKTANTFELSGVNGTSYTTYTSGGDIHPAIDASGYSAYVSAGVARERVTTLSGLAHLEGEVVSVLVEGAAHPDRTVASGAITLSHSSSKVHVGLSYISDLETLRLDAGARDGTAQGKLNRIHRVILRFLSTMGGTIGPDTASLDNLVFRAGGDLMDTAVPLFTGDVEVAWDGAFSSDNLIFYRQTQPLPVTLEAIMAQLITQDR